MEDIWAIVLAAGKSERMGFPKMLLNFRGSTILENVINTISFSGIANILVVLGAEKKAITGIINSLPVKICYNENYSDGMLSSVICGIGCLPSDFDAVLIFQGDQPMIEPRTINSVIEAYNLSDKGIVIPVFEKKRGHPLLISSRYRDEIVRLDCNEGLRSLSYLYPHDVLEIEISDPGVLRDIDTYNDYMNELYQK